LQAIELSNGGKYAKADRRTQGEEHMTRDDITRIARVAGFVGFDGDNGSLRRFAALVRADERNKLAAWMMARGYATGHGDSIEDLLQELDWQIAENWTRGMVNGVEAEREACAKVCEDKNTLLAWPTYAAAIRARGQA
jgi:hypothetical protein